MKHFYFIIFLLISQAAFPDSFIIKNDGSKSEIKSNSFRVDASQKTIYYKLIDNEKEIKMNFKDFDYVVFGVNKFKTFKLDESNEISGFFVLAESKNKTLVSISVPDLDSEESTTIFYVFHILDAQGNVIESHHFNNIINQKNATLRAEIYGKVKFYFSECLSLLERLSYFDRNSYEVNNTAILGFFNKPVYVSCL